MTLYGESDSGSATMATTVTIATVEPLHKLDTLDNIDGFGKKLDDDNKSIITDTDTDNTVETETHPDLDLPDNEDNDSYNRSLIHNMPLSPSYCPKQPRALSFMVKHTSTGVIDTNGTGNSYSNYHSRSGSPIDDSDEKVQEFVHSFQRMKSTGANHVLISDWHHHQASTSSRSLSIQDSHTSYRRSLEKEIAHLKLQLAEARSKADTLQNDYNRTSAQNATYRSRMDDVLDKYDDAQKRCEELSSVVLHLQSNASKNAHDKSKLRGKFDRSNVERKSYMEKYKLMKAENKRLVGELEGRGMEVQGLKSENDWLKQQLHLQQQQQNQQQLQFQGPGMTVLGFVQDSVSELGDTSSDGDDDDYNHNGMNQIKGRRRVVTGIHEFLSFPSAVRRNNSTTKRNNNNRHHHHHHPRRRPTPDHNTTEEPKLESGVEYESLGYHSTMPSRRGLVPSRFHSSSIDFPSSSTATLALQQELQLAKSISDTAKSKQQQQQQQQIPTKWNWWSPFGAVEPDMNPKQDACHETSSMNDGDYSMEEFIQFPPSSTSTSTSRFIHFNQHKTFDASAKVLVPKRLNNI